MTALQIAAVWFILTVAICVISHRYVLWVRGPFDPSKNEIENEKPRCPHCGEALKIGERTMPHVCPPEVLG